jgi:hypothetical protein
MSIFFVEWLCTQGSWNPEVAIIIGAAARYRRAAVGSSHDDAHPDNSTLHTGAASSSYRPVRAIVRIVFEMLPAFS